MSFPLLEAAVARGGVALRQKRHGIWHEVSWRALDEAAGRIAGGFVTAGFAAGERVAIIADPSQEWLAALLGLWRAGLCPVAVAPELAADAAVALLRATGVQGAVCGGRAELVRALDAGGMRLVAVADAAAAREQALPHVVALESLGGPAGYGGAPQRLLMGGTETDASALLARATGLRDRLGLVRADNGFAMLPLADTDGLALALFVPMLTGGITDFGESPRTLGEDLRQSEPSVLLGPARLWQRLHRDVALAAEQAKGIRRRALQVALHGGASGLGFRLTVAKPLRRRLGLRRLRAAVSTGGISAGSTERFFQGLGIALRDEAPAPGVAGRQERALRDVMYLRHAIVRTWAGAAVAVVQADARLLGAWAARQGHMFTSYASLVELPAVAELLDGELRAANARLAENERLAGYVVTQHELAAAAGELTPTFGITPGTADRLLAAGTVRSLPG